MEVKRYLRVVFFILLAYGVGTVLKRNVISFAVVEGDSMSPTLNNGDLVLLRKGVAEIKPGDLITFEQKMGQTNSIFIKRLIAKGEQNIYIDNYLVYVNDKLFAESKENPPQWNKSMFDCRFSEIFHLQKDQYFVLGDNRCNSMDSRIFGGLQAGQIKGKVIKSWMTSQWAIVKWFWRS